MDQGMAYQGYINGTTSLYTNNADCMADPITKCGDDNGTGNSSLKCTCCGPSGLPVSPIPNPNYKSCSSHNGQNGMYGCADTATFNPKDCKKPGGGIPTNPNVYAKMKPDAGDIKRAIRETLRKLKR
jgi:hypothetical protein